MVLGIQVEMDPWRQVDRRVGLIERDIRPGAVPGPQQDEVADLRIVARHVVERRRPKGRLTPQVIHPDHDRTDAKHRVDSTPPVRCFRATGYPTAVVGISSSR